MCPRDVRQQQRGGRQTTNLPAQSYFTQPISTMFARVFLFALLLVRVRCSLFLLVIVDLLKCNFCCPSTKAVAAAFAPSMRVVRQSRIEMNMQSKVTIVDWISICPFSLSDAHLGCCCSFRRLSCYHSCCFRRRSRGWRSGVRWKLCRLPCRWKQCYPA